MSAELIQRVTECTPDRRTQAAIELAKLGTADAVQSLIGIASGGDYTAPVVGRRRWYSLFKSVLKTGYWQYGLNLQLAAIEALGHSRSEVALDFLRRVSECVESEDYHHGNRHDPYVYGDTHTLNYRYPNATGSLGTALDYSRYVDTPSTDELRGHRKDVHNVLNDAVRRLTTVFTGTGASTK